MLHEQSCSSIGTTSQGDQENHDRCRGFTAAERHKVAVGNLCSACGQEKTVTVFVKRDGKSYGPYLKCAACKKRHDAKGYQKHKDKRRATQKIYANNNYDSIKHHKNEYRTRNLTTVREYARNYYHTTGQKVKHDTYRLLHPERMRAYRAKWRVANSAKIRALNKAYEKANPDWKRDKNLRHRARKKLQRVGDWSLVVKWQRSWRNKLKVRCYWCAKMYPPTQCHSDHIVALAKGGIHEISNLCISCAGCNQRKTDRSLKVWNQLIDQPVLL